MIGGIRKEKNLMRKLHGYYLPRCPECGLSNLLWMKEKDFALCPTGGHQFPKKELIEKGFIELLEMK